MLFHQYWCHSPILSLICVAMGHQISTNPNMAMKSPYKTTKSLYITTKSLYITMEYFHIGMEATNREMED